PVARLGFKPSWGRQTFPGRFDSCCFPPFSRAAGPADRRRHCGWHYRRCFMAVSTSTQSPPRLTSLSHGGGCGCKIAPGVLSELLAGMPGMHAYSNLLVGNESSDDAAVYRLNDEQALIATTDFFMPIVDDPYDFGRIAATNALSDVYAMGGTPIMALAIVGMPINVLPRADIAAILEGGAAACSAAG